MNFSTKKTSLCEILSEFFMNSDHNLNKYCYFVNQVRYQCFKMHIFKPIIVYYVTQKQAIGETSMTAVRAGQIFTWAHMRSRRLHREHALHQRSGPRPVSKMIDNPNQMTFNVLRQHKFTHSMPTNYRKQPRTKLKTTFATAIVCTYRSNCFTCLRILTRPDSVPLQVVSQCKSGVHVGQQSTPILFIL